MRLFITGDLHGEMDVKRLSAKSWPVGKTLCKKDILIIAGDFGLVWNGSETEEYWLDWLDAKPWTTVFIDGNHENFPALRAYPEFERFGGVVGVLRYSVFHLKKRGYIYNIGGKRFWCFGGALSLDKEDRRVGETWWREEEASPQEMEYGLSVLNDKKNLGKIDFVLTHDAPSSLLYEMYKNKPIIKSKTTDFLDTALERFVQYNESLKNAGILSKLFSLNSSRDDEIRPRRWYFGHHHRQESYTFKGIDFRVLFRDIEEIDV